VKSAGIAGFAELSFGRSGRGSTALRSAGSCAGGKRGATTAEDVNKGAQTLSPKSLGLGQKW